MPARKIQKKDDGKSAANPNRPNTGLRLRSTTPAPPSSPPSPPPAPLTPQSLAEAITGPVPDADGIDLRALTRIIQNHGTVRNAGGWDVIAQEYQTRTEVYVSGRRLARAWERRHQRSSGNSYGTRSSRLNPIEVEDSEDEPKGSEKAEEDGKEGKEGQKSKAEVIDLTKDPQPSGEIKNKSKKRVRFVDLIEVPTSSSSEYCTDCEEPRPGAENEDEDDMQTYPDLPIDQDPEIQAIVAAGYSDHRLALADVLANAPRRFYDTVAGGNGGAAFERDMHEEFGQEELFGVEDAARHRKLLKEREREERERVEALRPVAEREKRKKKNERIRKNLEKARKSKGGAGKKKGQ